MLNKKYYSPADDTSESNPTISSEFYDIIITGAMVVIPVISMACTIIVVLVSAIVIVQYKKKINKIYKLNCTSNKNNKLKHSQTLNEDTTEVTTGIRVQKESEMNGQDTRLHLTTETSFEDTKRRVAVEMTDEVNSFSSFDSNDLPPGDCHHLGVYSSLGEPINPVGIQNPMPQYAKMERSMDNKFVMKCSNEEDEYIVINRPSKPKAEYVNVFQREVREPSETSI